MGRRKIEIQPILHDRNRSVTFLKRKNGLFKKAYELGVLCSVDVLVVVFGHNQKLYEYCSSQNGNPSKILDKRVHFGGEREGRSPLDFNGDKSGGGNDDNDNDNDNDDLDLDLGEDSDEATSNRRPPQQQSASKSQQNRHSTRGRTTANDHDDDHDDPDPRNGRGPPTHNSSEHASSLPQSMGMGLGPSDPSSLSANVPYHIVQLLAAAAASGSLNSNQQQAMGGSLYNDTHQQQQQQQQGMNQNSVAAASSLGASLAQLLGGNPYLASQLALPNLLSLGALGFNPAGGNAGLQLPGTVGAGFGPPGTSNSSSGAVHPLYNTPLFASLLQNQQQTQQLLQPPANQSQFTSALFPGLPQHNQHQSFSEIRDGDISSNAQRPSSSNESSSRSGPGGSRSDWPAAQPALYRPSSSTDDLTSSNSASLRERDERSHSPSFEHTSASLSNQAPDPNQSSTFIDFLNAISSSGGGANTNSSYQNQPQTNGFGSSQNQNLGGLGNYGLSNLTGTGMNSSGSNSALSLFGNLGLGMGLPGMNMGGGFPSASAMNNQGAGVGGGHGALGMSMPVPHGLNFSQPSSSQDPHDSRGRGTSSSASRKRSREFDDDLSNVELDFPLPPSIEHLPVPRGMERYMNNSDEGGGTGGAGSRGELNGAGGTSLNGGDSGGARGDALHLDTGRNTYEEDVSGVRASKRGRAG